MGKVVKTVAVIAVGAAIAYYAPILAPKLLAAAGAQAASALAVNVVAAGIAAAATIALGMAVQAISAAPGDQPSGFREAFVALAPGGTKWVEHQPLEPVAEALGCGLISSEPEAC